MVNEGKGTLMYQRRKSVGSMAAKGMGSKAFSGQSVSNTSGSVGSPPLMMSTPGVSEDISYANMDGVDHGDDAASEQSPIVGIKKRRPRQQTGDKSNRGLRQFSMRVCEKVKSKGSTTYNEVADELVREFSDPSMFLGTPDQQQYDEKNIRRRVYDALNVLMAMDIISKDKKDIQWKGLPQTTPNDVEDLKTECEGLTNKIGKKVIYLQELEEQFMCLQNLIQRNEELYGSGNAPSGGVALPFILIQTRPHATVEVEISEDMQLVHFDFASTPFELHDDNYVLKAMKSCQVSQGDLTQNSTTIGLEDGIPNVPKYSKLNQLKCCIKASQSTS